MMNFLELSTVGSKMSFIKLEQVGKGNTVMTMNALIPGYALSKKMLFVLKKLCSLWMNSVPKSTQQTVSTTAATMKGFAVIYQGVRIILYVVFQRFNK